MSEAQDPTTLTPTMEQEGLSKPEAIENSNDETSTDNGTEVAFNTEEVPQPDIPMNDAPLEAPIEPISNQEAIHFPEQDSLPTNDVEPTLTSEKVTTEPEPTKKFSNPFIIESISPQEPTDPSEDSTISIQGDEKEERHNAQDEEDDDDDEYEPSAPIIPKKSINTPPVTGILGEPSNSRQGTPAALSAGSNISVEFSESHEMPENTENTLTTTALQLEKSPKTSKYKRLALDTIGKLQDKLEEDPQDISLWISLIDSLKLKDKIDEARETYEKVLEYFPLAASVWVSYIDLELAHGNFLKVETLFSKSLTTVYSVKLWQSYLEYVLRMNNIQTNGDKARVTIQQTYEFVLEKIGLDRESGTIWAQHIDFVRSKETSTTWEQQQQMDSLRKIYRKAICIPLNNLESLWHGYNTFENNINKSTARKFLAEKSAIYMTARSSLKELQNITTGLSRSTTPEKRRWVRSEERQLELWRNWISWEKKNPLELTDSAVVRERVTYAYRQAVMTMWFYPEIWFEAADYALLHDSDDKEALEILNLGMKANPSSALLFFKAAEVLESSGKKQNARKMYETLLSNLKEELSKLEEMLENLQSEEETTKGSKLLKLSSIQKLYDAKAKDITFTYIAFMKAVKRMEGITQARHVFSECRKLPYSTFQIYIASATMELRNDKPDIATKIFEIGLKRFSLNAEYIEEYIDFLIRINDDTNARALFEKSITKIDAAEAKGLYNQFLNYEARFGELISLKKLEERYKTLYPGGMILNYIRT